MNTSQQLHKAGQSIWYDNVERRLLNNGELAGMIARGEIRGVTSNPTIFMNAVTKSHDYEGWRAGEGRQDRGRDLPGPGDRRHPAGRRLAETAL
jgi:hypothetical protein